MTGPSSAAAVRVAGGGPASGPGKTGAVGVCRHICQEVCPWNQRFAQTADERDYAARPAWEAEWDADPDDADDEGPTEVVIPTTDGPALVDLMRMGEGEWDAYTRGSAMRRAGYSGLRRNVAIALGNWLAGGATPDPEAVGELVAALSDEDPVVGEAAAWGLGRVELQGQP